jgi:peptidyl-prolyl cis-trans isomerase C
MSCRSELLAVFLALGLSLGSTGSLLAQQPAAAAEDATAATGSDARNQIVLSVDGDSMSAADVEKILQALPSQSRDFYSGQGWHLLPQFLVRMKVLLSEARKQKLDQNPDVRATIQFATESILADAARRQIAQNIPAPDDLVAQMYQSKKREYEEVRLRQLLIRTESSILSQSSAPARPPLSSEDARKKLEELRTQILNGADFAELARANSDDPTSAASGGDTGFVRYQDVIPPIAQAADALAPGKVSDIIPTPFGMLLVQVVEKRTRPFTEVRPELEATVRQDKLEQRLQELQSQYKITVDDKFFAPKNVPQPAPFGAAVANPETPAGR